MVGKNQQILRINLVKQKRLFSVLIFISVGCTAVLLKAGFEIKMFLGVTAGGRVHRSVFDLQYPN